ncbi:hypothetical protein CAOG_01639 [Capsaspora owczarzaki ATCC 30864]|uniref:Uncharacterized protein n=1 Tax=Capsaspora owczarzaki (strain ATCC 30864) TaxID=595528 RepID=A0A0D2WKT9_CAPO3|nr:hypothetical protein CAOG_01639 [Capsaspora owczarzaki ATCC 30864]KJE90308.1 hypothetical protein CAOG_001639 [Capsaspora owczarzaki ATCC 30864]|eukprot:XP_004364507.2 hypothetical protein CAOG_01639 [Capsaspora owczarzaki ATCC 30864]
MERDRSGGHRRLPARRGVAAAGAAPPADVINSPLLLSHPLSTSRTATTRHAPRHFTNNSIRGSTLNVAPFALLVVFAIVAIVPVRGQNFWDGGVKSAVISWWQNRGLWGPGWVNNWDTQVYKVCPANQAITGWYSENWNKKEDRLFWFVCNGVQYTNLANCLWTDYLNQFDTPINFDVGASPNKIGSAIIGWFSVHDNGKEDRKTQHYYCRVGSNTAQRISSCRDRGDLNGWDDTIAFEARYGDQDGSVLTAHFSHHDNDKEDRIYRFRTCVDSLVCDFNKWGSTCAESCSCDTRYTIPGWDEPDLNRYYPSGHCAQSSLYTTDSAPGSGIDIYFQAAVPSFPKRSAELATSFGGTCYCNPASSTNYIPFSRHCQSGVNNDLSDCYFGLTKPPSQTVFTKFSKFCESSTTDYCSFLYSSTRRSRQCRPPTFEFNSLGQPLGGFVDHNSMSGGNHQWYFQWPGQDDPTLSAWSALNSGCYHGNPRLDQANLCTCTKTASGYPTTFGISDGSIANIWNGLRCDTAVPMFVLTRTLVENTNGFENGIPSFRSLQSSLDPAVRTFEGIVNPWMPDPYKWVTDNRGSTPLQYDYHYDAQSRNKLGMYIRFEFNYEGAPDTTDQNLVLVPLSAGTNAAGLTNAWLVKDWAPATNYLPQTSGSVNGFLKYLDSASQEMRPLSSSPCGSSCSNSFAGDINFTPPYNTYRRNIWYEITAGATNNIKFNPPASCRIFSSARPADGVVNECTKLTINYRFANNFALSNQRTERSSTFIIMFDPTRPVLASPADVFDQANTSPRWIAGSCSFTGPLKGQSRATNPALAACVTQTGSPAWPQFKFRPSAFSEMQSSIRTWSAAVFKGKDWSNPLIQTSGNITSSNPASISVTFPSNTLPVNNNVYTVKVRVANAAGDGRSALWMLSYDLTAPSATVAECLDAGALPQLPKPWNIGNAEDRCRATSETNNLPNRAYIPDPSVVWDHYAQINLVDRDLELKNMFVDPSYTSSNASYHPAHVYKPTGNEKWYQTHDKSFRFRWNHVFMEPDQDILRSQSFNNTDLDNMISQYDRPGANLITPDPGYLDQSILDTDLASPQRLAIFSYEFRFTTTGLNAPAASMDPNTPSSDPTIKVRVTAGSTIFVGVSNGLVTSTEAVLESQSGTRFKSGFWYHFYVRAYNMFGHVSAWARRTVLVDLDPPSVSQLIVGTGDACGRTHNSKAYQSNLMNMNVFFWVVDTQSGVGLGTWPSVDWKLCRTYPTGTCQEMPAGLYLPLKLQSDLPSRITGQARPDVFEDGFKDPVTSSPTERDKQFYRLQTAALTSMQITLQREQFHAYQLSSYEFRMMVTDRAGLFTTRSAQVTMDLTPPEPGFVADVERAGLINDIDHQNSLELFAYWDSFFDHESGIHHYEYALGTPCSPVSGDPDACNVLCPTSAEQLVVTDAHAVHVHGDKVPARAVKGACPAVMCVIQPFQTTSDPLLKDTTEKFDYGARRASVDLQQGYLDAAGVRHNTSQLLATMGERQFGASANQTLRYNRRFHFAVRAYNAADSTVAVCSDGIDVDHDAQAHFDAIKVSNSYRGTDGRQYVRLADGASKLRVELEWNFLDEGAGVAFYRVGLGTAAEHTEVGNRIFWNDGVLENSLTLQIQPGIQLEDGEEFVINVVAVTMSGREITGTSAEEYIVVISPPTEGIVQVAQGGSGQILVSWNGMIDIVSGVDHFDWAIGSYMENEDIKPFIRSPVENYRLYDWVTCTNNTHNINCNLQIDSEPLAKLLDGHSYWLTVRAWSHAGLFSTSSAATPFLVDRSPPYAGTVVETLGPESHIDIDAHNGAPGLFAVWDGFNDPHTGIALYEVAIGTSAGAEDILAFAGGSLPCGFDVHGNRKCQTWYLLNALGAGYVLTPGVVYYVSVRGFNEKGLFATAFSDGVRILPSSPTPAVISVETNTFDERQANVSFGGIFGFQLSTTSVTATWTDFSSDDTFSHYLWSIVVSHDEAPEAEYAGIAGVTLFDPPNPTDYVATGAIARGENGLLSFSAGDEFRVYVQVCDKAATCVISSTDLYRIDDSPPVPTGGLSATLEFPTRTTVQFNIEFDEFEDYESDVLQYAWAIGTLPSPTAFVTEFFNVSEPYQVSNTVHRLMELPVAFTTPMFITLRAWNRVGLRTDRTVPAVPVDGTMFAQSRRINILDVDLASASSVTSNSSFVLADRDYTSSDSSLAASFDGFPDTIMRYTYEWSIGTAGVPLDNTIVFEDVQRFQPIIPLPRVDMPLSFANWINNLAVEDVAPVRHNYVYLFNLTNAQNWTAGLAQPIVAEVGPYVYKQVEERLAATFDSKRTQLDYVRYVRQEFDSALSGGRNDTSDGVVVLNAAYLRLLYLYRTATYKEVEALKYLVATQLSYWLPTLARVLTTDMLATSDYTAKLNIIGGGIEASLNDLLWYQLGRASVIPTISSNMSTAVPYLQINELPVASGLELFTYAHWLNPATYGNLASSQYFALTQTEASAVYGILTNMASLDQFVQLIVLSSDSPAFKADALAGLLQGVTMSAQRRIDLVDVMSNYFMYLATAFLDYYDSRLVCTRLVRDVVLGYQDRMLARLKVMDPTFGQQTVRGILTHHASAAAATSTALPEQMHTGTDDIENVNYFAGIGGLAELATTGFTSAVAGYDGVQLPCALRNTTWLSDAPLRTHYYIFDRDMRRASSFEYTGNSALNNLHTVNRFELASNALAASEFARAQFALMVDGAQPLLMWEQYPLYMSKPHFLHANSSLLLGVGGLNANPAIHNSFLEADPMTGRVLNGGVRWQFSLSVINSDTPLLTPDIPLGENFVPVGWFDLRTETANASLIEFRNRMELSKIASAQNVAKSVINSTFVANSTAPLLPNDAIVPSSNNVDLPRVVTAIGLHLLQGVRYYVCFRGRVGSIEAPFTYGCSNGITVDLTPPVPAHICDGSLLCNSLANDKDYQVSISEMYGSWQPFVDLEESELVHLTGIAYYEWAIGSSPGGIDVFEFRHVGTALKAVAAAESATHGFQVAPQAGVRYFITVRGTDLVGLSATAFSDGIILDPSPPVVGKVTVARIVANQYHTDINAITVDWAGFVDLESGIDSYSWGIGTVPGLANVRPFVRVPSMSSATQTNLANAIQQAHVYYIVVRAENGAGLHSFASSLPITVDSTPPSIGQVLDVASIASIRQEDDDYSTNRTSIAGQWLNFVDPESGIKVFEWAVGTKPNHEDVMLFTPVGTSTVASRSGLSLTDGRKYFVTLRACNMAGLCSVGTSNGIRVDGSRPSTGRVFDGFSHLDLVFQSQTDMIGAHWYGFHDAHSGIARFDWCVESEGSGAECNTRGWETVFLEESALDPEVSLAHGVRYFARVRAYNGAGLYVTGISDGVRVDATPPTNGLVALDPIFPNVPSTYQISSALVKTTLSGFTDGESGLFEYTWHVRPVNYTAVNILQHKGHRGRDIMDIEMTGTYPGGMVSQLALQLGEKYHIVAEGVNGAGVGSALVSSPAFVVDWSSPAGGWVEHQVLSSTTIRVTWDAFVDEESDIATYRVLVGSALLGSNLVSQDVTPTPNATVTLMTTVVTLPVGFDATTTPYSVAVTARNGASLWCAQPTYSRSLQDSRLLPYADVVCASNNTVNLTGSVQVLDGFVVGSDITYQPYNDTFSGNFDFSNWCSSHSTICSKFVRFEFSIKSRSGLSDGDVLCTQFLHAVTADMATRSGVAVGTVHNPNFKAFPTQVCGDSFKMIEGQEYLFQVRAIANDGTCYLANSNGVKVLDSAPRAVLQRGYRVLDGLVPDKDLDYQSSSSSISASWSQAFDTSPQLPNRYELAVGTLPYLNNVQDFTPVGQQTNVTFDLAAHGKSLLVGHHYYVTIRCYTESGLFLERASDGVMVDNQPPMAGVVVDGLGPEDADYSSDPYTVSAMWWGFEGMYAPLAEYFWAIGTTPGADDVLEFTSVGLQVNATFVSPTPLAGKLYVSVYVLNAVGTSSSVVVSDGLVPDASAPDVGALLPFDPERHALCTPTVCAQRDPTQIIVTWSNWRDMQSGIDRFQWAIGTRPGGTQIQEYLEVEGEATNATNSALELLHGQEIYITLVAINGAGIRAKMTSQKLLVDLTPPALGQLRDGLSTTEDAVYQPTNEISANWDGFDDPESGILEYRWAIGTGKGLLNVMPMTSVGLATSASFNLTSGADGLKYFVTLEAVNNVAAITVAHSDGVQITAITPTVGSVVIYDYLRGAVEYLAANSSVLLEIEDFSDLHSGLATYSFAFEEQRGADWVMLENGTIPATLNFIQITNKPLAHSGVYRASVVATNRAGYSTVPTTATALIDLTPPVFAENATASCWEADQLLVIGFGVRDPESSPAGVEVEFALTKPIAPSDMSILTWDEAVPGAPSTAIACYDNIFDMPASITHCKEMAWHHDANRFCYYTTAGLFDDSRKLVRLDNYIGLLRAHNGAHSTTTQSFFIPADNE